jgi:glycerol-3-phosphate dehydrogenase
MDNAARPLSPEFRAESLDRMRNETFDVLVIGGGVTGGGAALDAATRGLSVALVEARDFASGTSSRSSKLIHGGLRYLEQLNFGLVQEALKERALILDRLCPHLAKPVPFILPLQHRIWERFYLGSGVLMYDTMAGLHRAVPTHRHLSRSEALRQFPSLRKDALVGAIKYYDGQVDDARHTMFLSRTAAHYGAALASSTRVTGLVREGDRVVGVRAVDLESAEQLEIRARVTINAAGVWTDDIQEMVGGRGQFNVRASKGVHILVPRDRIHGETGLISRTEKSVLFVIPWGTSHWIIGTTDTDWELGRAHPAASRTDIDYLLDHVNALLTTPLTREDVSGVYAGLRPLLAGESEATSKLSREHAVTTPVAGLVMVAGGKYTTYRVMAEDAVDMAVQPFPEGVPESSTETVRLVGAEGYEVAWNARERIAEDSGLHLSRVERLLDRYGSLIHQLIALIDEQPDLREPLDGADGYLRAEIAYAASHEGALHLDDLLTRRTRISIETFHRGVDVAEEVAAIVAPILGWDDDQVQREVEHYTQRVQAERESQEMEDDHTADAARMGAPDVRKGIPTGA